MRQRIRSSIVASVVLILLVSTVSVAVSTQALAQDGTNDVEAVNASASTDDATAESWSTYRGDTARSGATTADGPEPYGEVEWSDSFAGKPQGEPTVADGTAYVGVKTDLEYYKKVGAVVAYDTATGDVEWKRTELGAPRGSPTVVNDTAYVAVEGADPRQDWAQGPDGAGGLYAFDAETGETKWVRNETEFWLDAPVHVDGTLYTIREPKTPDAGNTSLVALDPETGETSWSVDADAIAGVADGSVYGTHDGDLFAVDTDTRERTWRVDASTVGDHGHFTELAVTDEAVYAVHDSPNGSLQASAYSTADGSTLWNVTVADNFDEVYRPAVTDDGVFLTADIYGELVRLDADTGAESWRYEPSEGGLAGGPTVANDTAYVGGVTLPETKETNEGYRGRNHAVFAVDVQDGTQQWGYVTEEGDMGSSPDDVLAPSVVGDRLYLSSNDGETYPQDATGYVHAVSPSPTEPEGDHVPSDGYHENDTDVTAHVETTESDPSEEFGDVKSVVLSGNGSSVRHANVTSYEWDVDDDGTFEETGEDVTVTVEPCNVRTVTLRVTTDEGATDTTSVVLTNE